MCFCFTLHNLVFWYSQEYQNRYYSKIFRRTSSGTSLGCPPMGEALALGDCGTASSFLASGAFSKIKSFNLFISSGLAARSLELEKPLLASLFVFLKVSREIGVGT